MKEFKTVLDAVGYVFANNLHKADEDGRVADLTLERTKDGVVKITFKPKDGKNERDND